MPEVQDSPIGEISGQRNLSANLCIQGMYREKYASDFIVHHQFVSAISKDLLIKESELSGLKMQWQPA